MVPQRVKNVQPSLTNFNKFQQFDFDQDLPVCRPKRIGNVVADSRHVNKRGPKLCVGSVALGTDPEIGRVEVIVIFLFPAKEI